MNANSALWHARNGRNAPAPASWTHWYWPTALVVSLMMFFGAQFFQPSLRGDALIAGMVLILIPEITVVLLHRWQDTFSDWVWNTVHVARNQPVSQWNAEHFLTFGAYCVIAASVVTYLFHLGVTAFTLGIVVAVWLAFHFFLQWWA